MARHLKHRHILPECLSMGRRINLFLAAHDWKEKNLEYFPYSSYCHFHKKNCSYEAGSRTVQWKILLLTETCSQTSYVSFNISRVPHCVFEVCPFTLVCHHCSSKEFLLSFFWCCPEKKDISPDISISPLIQSVRLTRCPVGLAVGVCNWSSNIKKLHIS